jgi:hypothetical protein
VVFKDETFWMTQKAMSELFDVNTPAIRKKKKNIFDGEELLPDSAVAGRTAAQLISERVSPDHPTMGLTTWKNAPDGKILKSDVSVAKN